MRRSLLRGWKDLVVDAVEHTTRLVEATHRGVSQRTYDTLRHIGPIAPVVDSVEAVETATSRLVYGSVIAVDRAVGAALDLALDGEDESDEETVPLRFDAVGEGSWLSDAGRGGLNGMVGDFLAARGSALAIETRLRHGEHLLPRDPVGICCAIPDATGKVVVFVHGLATTEWSWTWGDGETYASRFEVDHGYTGVFARYNTGRPVGESGAALAAELESVLGAWPVPLEEIVLVGHSMGGLVARHAIADARVEGHRWVEHCTHLACLGSPHRGAPLAKAGRLLERTLGAVDLPAPFVISQLLGARSAGIVDLEDGFPEVEALAPIRLHCVAGTLGDPSHLLSRLAGDVLVREESATAGRPDARVFPGLDHLQLANHPDVYAHLVARIVKNSASMTACASES